MVDGKERKVNTSAISELVDKLFDNAENEKAYIEERIKILIEDLEFDKEFMHGVEPEEYYTHTVKNYLAEHSFDDLYACADDMEIFDYCY